MTHTDQVLDQTKQAEKALKKLRQARQNYKQAEGEYVEVAAYELKAAEKRYELAIREEKEQYAGGMGR